MVDLKQRSPEAKRAYFEGYLAALKAAAKTVEQQHFRAGRDQIAFTLHQRVEMAEVSLRALGEE